MKTYLKLNNDVLNRYSTTGLLELEKDREATRRYFLEYVNVRLRYFIDIEEKIRYLVDEGYYEKDFIDMYEMDFIKKLYKKAYDYNFRFPSFMSASKFYDSYAMKSRDGEEILEKYEDRIVIIALYLAQGNTVLAKRSVEAMMEAYQPATPTALNSGKKARGELVSCFKLSMDDSMNSIAENIGYCLELSRLGGGVGVNLTDLRPLGDPIKEILNRASGVIPVAKLLENSFSYSNQLGQRNGSGVVYLNIFHADIENFISSKKPNADDKIRLATLSTGIIIPSIFFDLMKRDKDIVLFSPYDIFKVYGKRMSEISISEMYYELLDNPKIRKIKRLNARRLYTEVKKAQFESGYPFEIFDDNVNEVHPLKNIGRVKMSNLCTEILQVQETSVITDQDQPNEYGLDVSCNLGSIDIHAASKVNDFETLIDTAMHLLTNVSQMTYIKNVPSVAKANRLMHSVGLGCMNLHGHLVTEGIMYGSKDSIDFMDRFMEAMNYYSLKSSMEMAKEKAETFYRFEDSDYASGSYFDQYVNKNEEELSPAVLKALGNIPIITNKMWELLKEDVMEYGLFHSYRLAIAPTGSISYIRSCTASISPCTERVEVRDYADSRTIYPMPHLTNENSHLYVEAYDVDPYDLIDLYAASQKHVDQGISMTLYVTDNWTTEQLAKVYIYAWVKGIKSVYYVRQRLQSLEECVACQI
ncbi:class 1b ribonucleoside-diphosphate reductase subunit alpha [Lysinibacillus fusiformis]|jgi:ribonucleoside-diphosphate reductase alpha chain|uniref:class 1b ribonucleoside-diphosphate reductase subunit alpha n=1 Tax=Lysinibacillus TaxID=400634 RepID=UPI0004D6389F|nr:MULTISPECIES: class 1b ribonucleoside-diphosphate reductase subunit alpha [Lysinibacillus]MDC6268971.1 class 1b ribonucleoside-diphosphate reductase subunit alpha [Lysinibacillus sphaericus]AJK88746.1 ribonucleotide-diphosphate reductase subunit alpha [Lysinibacillus fusiformis]KAB0441591.1 class 1b ribonucleoside-diphosphate reductase subunit alpha [Lysinibacillus fusiformis]KGA83054.1 ribonucleotide-diphosphate reductase subunit alpha [Lysinibacillus fusiformis]KHK55294.1 ribonucleotide-d